FQALRIAVNEELEILASAVESALDCLHVDGRIVVESYHSGEDRLVKTAFTRRTRSSAPPGFPVELEEHKPTFSALVRGALQADDTERDTNSRAASVRLRALTRTRPDQAAHRDGPPLRRSCTRGPPGPRAPALHRPAPRSDGRRHPQDGRQLDAVHDAVHADRRGDPRGPALPEHPDVGHQLRDHA